MAFTARTEEYARGSSLTSPYNFTINKPSGVVDGDIMFMFLMIYVATPPTIDSVPSGWTQIATNTTTNCRWYLYYRIASGEGTSYTWSLSGSCRYYAINSAYTSGDFDVTSISDITAISNTLYGTAGTTVRAASMSVPDADSPMVYFAAIYNTTVRTFTKPTAPTTDWVEDGDEGHTTPDISTTYGSMIWTGSGTTGNMDVICSTSITTYKHAFAISLKPAAVPLEDSITETATASESSTAVQTSARSITETATASETSDAIGNPYHRDITEGEPASETSTAEQVRAGEITESAPASEEQDASYAFNVEIEEKATAGESSSTIQNRIANIEEKATASDISAVILYTIANITEQSPASESVINGLRTTNASINEPAPASESSSTLLQTQASIIEKSEASESSSAIQITNPSIIESAPASDICDGVIVAGGVYYADIIESAPATSIESASQIMSATIIEKAIAIDYCNYPSPYFGILKVWDGSKWVKKRIEDPTYIWNEGMWKLLDTRG